MNSWPRPYLNVTRSHCTQRGISTTSSCSTFTHSTWPMPLGEVEHLGLGERGGRVEAPLALPDQRRVQALLDRRPDRERGREVIALDDEVGAVAHPDFARRRRTAPRRRSGRARPTGRARRRCRRARAAPACSHCSCAGELVVAEHLPRQLVRALGVGLRERHRHVQVRDPRLEGRVEDRLVEARVAGVQHGVGRARARSARPSSSRSEASTRSAREAAGLAEPAHRRLRALERDVGEHDLLERGSRRWAIAANAAPTPPAPTTRTLIAAPV